jgi:CRISPR system Cascade subunit CasB
MNADTPDFADMHRRFLKLPPGAAAPMRRAAEPDDLRDTPGLYRLFPGVHPNDQKVRAAFILPWCPQLNGTKNLGALCADKIGEARIIQIARANRPDDLIALRRVVIQLSPALGWMDIAPTIWYWSGEPKQKRKFVEAFYIALHKLDKGAAA